VANTQPSPGAWAMIGGGAVTLIGSFLEFASDTSAWGTGAFPIVTLIPIYATVVGVLVALKTFGNVNLPAQVLGFTWNQLFLVLGFFAALMSLFWLVAAENTGVGLLLMLIGSVAVAVGAFLTEKEAAPGTLG
jgi:drug/metabolite transporter (DMT)-like permease